MVLRRARSEITRAGKASLWQTRVKSKKKEIKDISYDTIIRKRASLGKKSIKGEISTKR